MDKFRELSTRDRTGTARREGRDVGAGMDKFACPLSEIYGRVRGEEGLQALGRASRSPIIATDLEGPFRGG